MASTRIHAQSVLFQNSPSDMKRSLETIARAARLLRREHALTVDVSYGDCSPTAPCLSAEDLRQRRKLIVESGLFDPIWYLARYPDVAESQVDPLTHFIVHGSKELRSPSAHFNARHYYESYADLQQHRIEPVFHFILHGKLEGRRHANHHPTI